MIRKMYVAITRRALPPPDVGMATQISAPPLLKSTSNATGQHLRQSKHKHFVILLHVFQTKSPTLYDATVFHLYNMQSQCSKKKKIL